MASQVKRFDEINITPLTDIFLVLLIIMMVIAPSIAQKNEAVALPLVENGKAISKNLITVDVSAKGEYDVQGESVQASELGAKIKALLPTVTEQKVLLRADKASSNKAVLTVMKAVAGTGVERIVFEGEAAPPKKEASEQPSISEEGASPNGEF
ncbi:MAG: ExbD/TolR family protein [Vampirovibrionales bacterium]|jgi:biopolymer transport protein ExbD/biopolymer transport protein TolR